MRRFFLSVVMILALAAVGSVVYLMNSINEKEAAIDAREASMAAVDRYLAEPGGDAYTNEAAIADFSRVPSEQMKAKYEYRAPEGLLL